MAEKKRIRIENFLFLMGLLIIIGNLGIALGFIPYDFLKDPELVKFIAVLTGISVGVTELCVGWIWLKLHKET